MCEALGADLSCTPGVELYVLHDERVTLNTSLARGAFPVHDRASFHLAFDNALHQSDAALIIAPEFEGLLWDLSQKCRERGVPLLSPSPDFVAIAADKHATAERLRAVSVATPTGGLWRDGRWLTPPCEAPSGERLVCKPNDGAGSLDMQALPLGELHRLPHDRLWRIECRVPGKPVSVSLLCGGPTPLPCPALLQRMSRDGHFHYLGGCTIGEHALQQRAQQLAQRAVAAMPPCVGYVGVDLVLGSAGDGSGDVVIEVNPRLTTSYVGLRHLSHSNLAAAMLEAAQGTAVRLSWREEPLEFDAVGAVRWCNA